MIQLESAAIPFSKLRATKSLSKPKLFFSKTKLIDYFNTQGFKCGSDLDSTSVDIECRYSVATSTGIDSKPRSVLLKACLPQLELDRRESLLLYGIKEQAIQTIDETVELDRVTIGGKSNSSINIKIGKKRVMNGNRTWVKHKKVA